MFKVQMFLCTYCKCLIVLNEMLNVFIKCFKKTPIESDLKYQLILAFHR